MNDLYFTAKNKKACKDESSPCKPYKFNEILLCRMKSKQVWMKSSVFHLRWNQIRRSYPRVSGILSRSDFIHESGFIPTKADLVEKDSELYPILSLFLVGMTGFEPATSCSQTTLHRFFDYFCVPFNAFEFKNDAFECSQSHCFQVVQSCRWSKLWSTTNCPQIIVAEKLCSHSFKKSYNTILYHKSTEMSMIHIRGFFTV